jgi:Xaa-Pro dipeptidase
MAGDDCKRRVASLRRLIREEGLKGVLITSINDIYYYTGKALIKGDPAFLFIGPDSSKLYVSSLDNELEGPGVGIFNGFKPLREELKGPGTLGFDERNLSVFAYRNLRSGIWKPFSGKLKSLRMVKDKGELGLMKEAAKRTLSILGSLELKGRTEQDVASEIHARTRKAGDSPSFEPQVAAGRNSAFVHHIPGNARVSRGLVIVDMGVRHRGYCSDLTRTFLLNPTRKEREAFEACSAIQRELIGMAKPGTPIDSIQKRFSERVEALGYKAMHSFGHGLGLSVHERPYKGDVLEKGMVITVEPGIYKKGFGGCRIEDMVLVKDRPVLLSH